MCGANEPVAVCFVGETRQQERANTGMVGVQLCHLFYRQQVRSKRREVVGAERQRLKAKETSKFGFAVKDGEQDVLDANAKLSCHIDPRFIGDGHAFNERNLGAGSRVLANLMRTFVNTEVRADSVTGAVTEVETCFPKRTAGGEVKLQTAGALREGEGGEGEVTFEHKRIDFPLLTCQFPAGEGAGDVSRAAIKLGTAVQEEETASLHGGCGGGLGFIVHDGTV